jgi:hypothetical protein
LYKLSRPYFPRPFLLTGLQLCFVSSSQPFHHHPASLSAIIIGLFGSLYLERRFASLVSDISDYGHITSCSIIDTRFDQDTNQSIVLTPLLSFVLFFKQPARKLSDQSKIPYPTAIGFRARQ